MIRCARVVLPTGPTGEEPAAVVIRAGRVAEVRVGPHAQLPADLPLLDLPAPLVLSPGLVDSHVHIDEPGRTHWEGFASATRAAAAGGVTTLVDMPLNSLPPTTDVAALAVKRAAAAGQVWVDVAFWGGIATADTAGVAPLVDAGVCGLKVFLAPSGVPEFGALDADGLRGALAATAAAGVPLVVHAEAPGPLALAPAPRGRRYVDYLASRPPEAELEALRWVTAAAAATRGHVHVLHLSAAAGLAALAAAHAGGAHVTAETCPHYLSLAAEEIPDGGVTAKCAPPVREAANREALWDGLQAGLLAGVVSDHSPAPPEIKSLDTGDLGTAWGGISGLQTQLPVVWTAGQARGATPADLARWQSAGPAELAGLPAKGSISVGKDADLVAWDPDASFVVDPALLLHRHALSPWAGRTLRGVVHTTWLRGVAVDVSGPPRGRLLGRGDR